MPLLLVQIGKTDIINAHNCRSGLLCCVYADKKWHYCAQAIRRLKFL